MKKEPVSKGSAHPPFAAVKSSMISGIAYDPGAQRLHVKFPNGNHYTYEGVTPAQHAGLLSAESIGKHFAANIRGKFKHRLVPTEAAGR